MIKQLSIKSLQIALNKALSLDDQSQARLAALDGRIIQIIIKPLNIAFFILFANNQLLLKTESVLDPDTIIESSPLGLIRLSVLPASKSRSLFNHRVQLIGNMEVGQQVKALFDTLEVDWEGHLAHFTGDVVAYQVGSFVRKTVDFGRKFRTSMRSNISEYIQEEIRLTPSLAELHDFYTAVDHIVQDVDSLEAVITNLK